MSAGSQLPVSALIRQGDRLQDIDSKRRSKDEYRKQKDLEEQRKAGQAPAMVDVETGRDINPHIPEFIEKTPWYVPASGPTLKHQRPHPERQERLTSIKEWYPKGTTDKVAFKYRDGACENCGAMGHKKKDCFERPRKIGAKLNDQVIAADDYVMPKLKLGYDAKRDRWNGYDPAEYRKVHEEYEQMEETRKMIRAQNMKDGVEDPAVEEEAKGDEDMYAEDMAPSMSVDMDSRTRITVRNLRIREDTAKYLYSLDDNSAYYDPKSRSMRENPFANVPGKEKESAKFAGENFVRYTGEVVEANQAQVFAWQARCQGIDVHALAEPTKLEALKRAYEQKKTEHKSSATQELIDKYGGQEHLNVPQKELLLAQTESYVEYNRTGSVIRGQERSTVKSKYDEDIFIQNHTSVWGSYWRDNKWGYKCCHSFFKNSYCIGEKGYAMESTVALGLTSAAAAKKESVDEDNTATDQNESKAEESEGPNKTRKLGSSASSSASESGSAFEDEAKVREDNDVISVDEEELEREKEKKLRDEKRLETRREKRRRKKDRQKHRPKKSAKSKRKERKEKRRERRKHRKSASHSSTSSSSSSSSTSSSEDEDDDAPKDVSKELAIAIRKVKADEAEGRRIAEMGDRKRKYNSHYHDEKPSKIEIEAYQRTRIHASDPMASLMTANDVVELAASKKTRKQ